MQPQNATIKTAQELRSARPHTGEPNAAFGCTEATIASSQCFHVHSIHASVGPTPAEATTATWHYQSNQQYSITAVTTSSGSVAERYAYTSYGQPTILDGTGSVLSSSAINNRYTYTGREWDATLGLYHFRARWMSGIAGRFMGRDPIGYKGGFSLYRCLFVMKGLDPSGRQGLDADAISRTCNQVASAYAVLELKTICPASQFTFRVRCVSCGPPSQEFPSGLRARTTCNSNPALLELQLCNDRIGGRDDTVEKLRNSLMGLVLHEWVHVGDYCNCSRGCDAFKPKKIPLLPLEDSTSACERHFCTEIRAKHADGECDGEPDEGKRQDCIKRIMKERYLPGQPSCKEANIDKAMRECYQPYGEELQFPHDFLR